MSNTVRSYLQYLPSIDQLHEATREVALLVFAFFAIMSLVLLLGELFASHGVTSGPEIEMLRYAAHTVLLLWIAWFSSAVARAVKGVIG